jgi:hypothetical protein
MESLDFLAGLHVSFLYFQWFSLVVAGSAEPYLFSYTRLCIRAIPAVVVDLGKRGPHHGTAFAIFCF